MNDVFVMSLHPDGEWHHSKFPHPLITVDYDSAGRVIQIVGVGPMAERWSEPIKAIVEQENNA